MLSTRPGRGILYAYMGIALPGLFAVLLVPHLIKNLGVARFGILSLLLSVSAFFASFDFGVGPAMTRYVSRLSFREHSLGSLHRLVNVSLALQLTLGILIALAFFLLNKISGKGAGFDSGIQARELGLAMGYTALAIPLAQICGTARCILEGRGRFGIANILRAPTSLSTFVVPILTSFLTTRLDLIVLSLLVARITTAIAFMVALRASGCLALAPSRLRLAIKQGKILLSYGGWVMVGTSAGGMIIMGILDRFLVDRLIGAKSIIIFSVPSDIVLRCLLAPGAIASVMIPVLSRSVVAGESMVGIYRNALRLMVGQIGPICVLLAFNTDIVLRILAKGYLGQDSRVILLSMVVGLFFVAVGHVPYSLLHAFGYPHFASGRHLVELPIYLVSSIVLLHLGQLRWIGLMWTAWAFLDLLFVVWLVRRVQATFRIRILTLDSTFLGWTCLILLAVALGTLHLTAFWHWSISGVVGAVWGYKLLGLVNNEEILHKA